MSGWQPWRGGDEPPVGRDQLVDVEFRNGMFLCAIAAGSILWWHLDQGRPGHLGWSEHVNDPYNDVIGWRLVA